jgi:hypothetical protein
VNVDDLPIIGRVHQWGAEETVYDALLLCGPLVVLVIAVLGRTSVTVGLTGLYVASFVGYALSRAVWVSVK